MNFKRIELIGFKSFADKTKVDFDDGITAIVGPNGCGKSNVADAIRWVLGEQRTKLLRGNSMQDVIFAGTTERKSLSYCEVSLVFDNSDRIFDTDYDEVIISRKLYRSGESDYSINKTSCRLKDITNLLYNSGIGRDGYSIIGQGKVEEILNSKPENRRAIFEDAAGISGFKAKKVESERKLERTRDNLTRLRDIIGEIERQLKPMKSQAETAKKFLILKEQLKHLELNNYIYQYDSASDQKKEIGTKIDGYTEDIAQKEEDLQNILINSHQNFEDIKDIDKTTQQLNNELLELTVSLEKHSGDTKVLQEKVNYLKYLTERVEGINAKLESEQLKHVENEKAGSSQSQVLNSLRVESGALEQKLNVLTEEYNSTTNAVNKLNENYITTKSALNNTENRSRMLKEMQREFEGFAGSVKLTLKASEQNDALKKRIVGVVANLISVPEKFVTAVEMALGNAVQNIVTEDEDDAKYIINFLKEKRYGRATFLPMTAIKPRYISDSAKDFLKSKGCFGIASDLISYDDKLDNIFKGLLGATVIVDTLQTAINMAKESRYSFKIVTLEGDVINPQGSITGGSQKNDIANLVGRDREIENLSVQYEKLEKELETIIETRRTLSEKSVVLSNDLKELTNKFNGVQVLLAQQQEKFERLDFLTTSASDEISALINEKANTEASIKSVEKEIKLGQKFDPLEADSLTLANRLVESNLSADAMKDVKEKIAIIRGKLDNLDAHKVELQNSQNVLEENRTSVQNELNLLQNKKYREELNLAKVDTDIENMQERIWEEYELTYTSALPYKAEEYDLKQGLIDYNTTRRDIDKLGYVNVNAIEDCKVLEERYDILSAEANDLIKAEQDLTKIIKELSAEMLERFNTEFEKINNNFMKVFRELFGGGNAKLVLTEPDETGDLLTQGIDIIAEPPGKKLQNITLLSGGEKALTAIAILFAILKLRPMPFCLLDEIEAALDDANVGRFAKYLHKFSNETQFIVITHRKPTMELADALYGVTMEEKGVSKIVSVKLSEAVQNADLDKNKNSSNVGV
ncbi:MAG: chromosome segregation protein SMC [Spirochaetales bacterium]